MGAGWPLAGQVELVQYEKDRRHASISERFIGVLRFFYDRREFKQRLTVAEHDGGGECCGCCHFKYQ